MVKKVKKYKSRLFLYIYSERSPIFSFENPLNLKISLKKLKIYFCSLLFLFEHFSVFMLFCAFWRATLKVDPIGTNELNLSTGKVYKYILNLNYIKFLS